MYHLKDGPERVLIKEELMFIPEDIELLLDYVKNGENVPASKMSFSTPEHFEENMVQHGSILKW